MLETARHYRSCSLSPPELATARGYFDEYYEYPYFRGATLLHHLAGEPQRVPLPENAVELASALISAGADRTPPRTTRLACWICS